MGSAISTHLAWPLLAPSTRRRPVCRRSLQECCPLIVMEACLRSIPCISSDVFGLPEANANANLVVHASLCYDHARGILHHNTTNSQLESKYGNTPPPLPSAAERAANVSKATKEEATAEEAAPFEEVLRRLLGSDEALREEGARGREAFYAFALRREHGLRNELWRVAAARRRDEDAGGGGGGGGCGGGSDGGSGGSWQDAPEALSALGYSMVPVTEAGVKVKRRGAASSDDPDAETDAEEVLLRRPNNPLFRRPSLKLASDSPAPLPLPTRGRGRAATLGLTRSLRPCHVALASRCDARVLPNLRPPHSSFC